MVKKSESKAKTKVKDENTTFIVNPLQFFMKGRLKTAALEEILQLMLQYYNEKIAEAKVLLYNKVATGKSS